MEHRHCFVKDPNPAILSHSSTISSYMVRIHPFLTRGVEGVTTLGTVATPTFVNAQLTS